MARTWSTVAPHQLLPGNTFDDPWGVTKIVKQIRIEGGRIVVIATDDTEVTYARNADVAVYR